MMRPCLTAALAVALALPAMAQVIPSPPKARIVEGFLSHRAVYDLKLKSSQWASSVTGLNGRLVSDFDDVCNGFTFSQRIVTNITDTQGQATTGNFWVSTYESSDGRNYRFALTNTVDSKETERTVGQARRDESGLAKVDFQKPSSRNITIPGSVVFPTEFMGRVVRAAQRGERGISAKMFEGDAEGKVYDAFASIGTDSAATPEEIATPGGESLRGLRAWPVTLTYYVRGADTDLPDYETSFRLFENGVTSAVTLDYGEFTVSGRLRRIEEHASPRC
jgi:hypothetical protein